MVTGRQPLRALKDLTRDLHLRAEQYVRILDENATVDDYARYLIAMRGFHAPIEERLGADAELEGAGFAARDRRKTHLLARDLLIVAPSETATLRCSALPVSDSLAQRIGIAYVIEGSTLGGKFILARLPPALAALKGRATAFLEGYGAATGAMWKSFAGVVERVVTSAETEAEAVAAARDTFTRLIAWLGRFEQPDVRRMREAS
jgi:heme oxygenase (biliverdin-IX-beta and delta-forming)